MCSTYIFIERRVRRKKVVKRAVPDGSYLKAAWRLLAVDRLYSQISSLNIEENMAYCCGRDLEAELFRDSA